MCGCLSHAPTGDLAPNPGMCPDWESNRRPCGSQRMLNPLSHPSQGEVVCLDRACGCLPTGCAIIHFKRALRALARVAVWERCPTHPNLGV